MVPETKRVFGAVWNNFSKRFAEVTVPPPTSFQPPLNIYDQFQALQEIIQTSQTNQNRILKQQAELAAVVKTVKEQVTPTHGTTPEPKNIQCKSPPCKKKQELTRAEKQDTHTWN